MKRVPAPQPAPEFNRPFDTGEMTGAVEARRIEANGEERRALARRFGLLSLDRLEAVLEIRRMGPGLFRIEGRLQADVVQQCVVTLDPVPSAVDSAVEATFAREARETDAEDAPEPLDGNMIELGEVVAQELALALDPYPRKPGVRIEDVLPGGDGAEASSSPFAKLSEIKKKRG
jgi:uncharacterized metal-binding protein YceD (DUF177 family)